MAEALFSNNLPLPGPPSFPNPSRPSAGKLSFVAVATIAFASVSSVKHAAGRTPVPVQSARPSGVDAGETSTEAGETKAQAGTTTTEDEEAQNAWPEPKGGLNLPDLPNIPGWVRGFVGSLVVLSMPFYKRFLNIEDEVEKTVETVVEVAEDVAKMTKNLAADAAESLPDEGLKKLATEIEEIAEVAVEDSEKVKSFICKVDEVIEEVDHVVESIDKEAEGKFLKRKSS